MSPRPLKCFFGAPFSEALEIVDGKVLGFSPHLHKKWTIVYNALRKECGEVWSSHVAEEFGKKIHEDEIINRDLRWLMDCDVFVALLPLDESGRPYRSDGLLMECGSALAIEKPMILITERLMTEKRSYFLAGLQRRKNVVSIPWLEFIVDPLYNIKTSLDKLGWGNKTKMGRPRREISKVDEIIHACESQKKPHTVVVNGTRLVVLPGVFSPQFSHSSDFVISHLEVLPGAKVLDLGCGTGVLGVNALKSGGKSLVSVDINPAAVENTRENIRRLRLSDSAEVFLSDCYEKVKGKFDLILFNAPYWDRKAQSNLERAVFDEGYQFLRRAIKGARTVLKPNGVLYLCFSDQGDMALVTDLIYEAGLHVEREWLQKSNREDGHIRILWRVGKLKNLAQ